MRKLGERHLAGMKINGQTPPPQEVETEQTINPCAGWHGVTQDWEPCTLLPESYDPVEYNAWHKLDTASCGHLDAVWHQGWIVADSD
jgi:hypothetical protein